MTNPHYLLAIDCGTQSIRALVFDRDGELVAKTQVALDNYFSKEPGWVEQHVHVFWDAFCRACHKLWDETSVKPEHIAGIAVTTQRATIINVNQQGEPLRPAMIWMDQRRATALPKLDLKWRAAFKLAGVSDTVGQFMQDAEVNWLYQHQPEIVAKTHKFLLVSGYLNFKLSGEFKDSVGSQVGYLPFDYKRHQWATKTDWKWQACPIQLNQLPELVATGGILGEVSEQAYQHTGLLKGLPIIASAADKACEILGCGALEPHQGQISYGTTATFNVTSKRYIEPIRYLPPYPSAVPDHYCCEYQIYRGYWMVSWFKEQFAHLEFMKAQAEGLATEDILCRQASLIPPGSDGLILQPYWSPGVRHPGPEARGAIIGFNDRHTRAHIYRAMLEGIAFGLFDGKQRIEDRSKSRITELLVSGGGSQSTTALQITADIFNLPVKRPKTFETSGLGAAIHVAVALGVHRDYKTAASAMCHNETEISPIATNVHLYQDIYQHVYRKMYPRLLPLYRRLSHIYE